MLLGAGMQNRDTYLRTLQSAMTIAGSELVLAVRLRTDPGQIKKWLAGAEAIPDAAFLDAVDIVVTAQIIGNLRNPN